MLLERRRSRKSKWRERGRKLISRSSNRHGQKIVIVVDATWIQHQSTTSHQSSRHASSSTIRSGSCHHPRRMNRTRGWLCASSCIAMKQRGGWGGWIDEAVGTVETSSSANLGKLLLLLARNWGRRGGSQRLDHVRNITTNNWREESIKRNANKWKSQWKGKMREKMEREWKRN